MKITFPILGYIMAAVLFVLLLIQRGCVKKLPEYAATKTVTIAGDTKFVKVHDTVERFKKVPGRTVHDTVIAWSYQTIYDTVYGQDAVVAISDSLMNDSTIRQKVSIKNTRAKQEITMAPDNKFKMFVGFTMGLNLGLTSASAGPSVIFLTGYDFINQVPTIGMAWKLHFGK